MGVVARGWVNAKSVRVLPSSKRYLSDDSSGSHPDMSKQMSLGVVE